MTAYELRISDWSSDVCSSDLFAAAVHLARQLLDQRDLFGIVAHIAAEPRHELARAAPLIFIDAPVLFLQPDREAAERRLGARDRGVDRSEEHTSELQSLMRSSYAVFCLKKKKTQY